MAKKILWPYNKKRGRFIQTYRLYSLQFNEALPNCTKRSSFDKFVQNGFYEQDWCNFEDKYKISNLDYK